MRKNGILGLVLLGALFAANPSWGLQVELKGEKTFRKRFSLAITANKSEQEADRKIVNELIETVRKDLSFSGYFDIFDDQKIIEKNQAEDQAAKKINFTNWAQTHAKTLAVFEISKKDEDLNVNAVLYDLAGGSPIFARKYKTKPKFVRRLAHRFSDEVMFRYTGVKGPFSTYLSFVKTNAREKEIYVCDYDGRGQHPVTMHRSISISPSWSPGGSIISYTTFFKNNTDLYMVDIFKGIHLPVSEFPGINSAGNWSPDGTRIAMTLSKDGNNEIYIVEKKSKRMKRLTRNKAIDTSPAWSPDGKKIVFNSNRGGSPQIYVMDSDGKNVGRLTYEGNYNSSPKWSPKGGLIAYCSRVDGVFQIMLMDEEGNPQKQLTQGPVNSENPTWSPDGRYLAFHSAKSGKKQLYIMTVQGENPTQITYGKQEASSPAWSAYLFNKM